MQTYQFTYEGKWPSSNIIYRLTHRQRHKLEVELKQAFTPIIEAQKVGRVNTFKLHFEYRSRLDPDNISPGAKTFCDTLRALGIIEQDTSKFYKGLTITPNMKLPVNNTYIIRLEVLS